MVSPCSRERARSFVLATISLLGITLAAPALGREPPIASVEVRTMVERGDRDLRELLRDTVESELSRMDLSGAPTGTRFVLSASLVRLETSTSRTATRSSCRVSLTLREVKRGALHAILDGSALAEDSASGGARAENGAIAGAVRGAMRSLPEAVRKRE